RLAKDSSGRVILFGGTDGSAYFNETWVFTGTAWSQLSPVTQPAVRANAGMATDASGQVILFGGVNGSGLLGDTWTWNGSRWLQVNALSAPSARQVAAMAFFKNPGGGNASGIALFGGQ